MAELQIRVALAHALKSDAAFPRLAEVIARIAEAAHRQWVAYANGAPLPGGGRIMSRTGEYSASIQLAQRGPYRWEVFSELPYARAIEYGSPARDLKQMLGSSLKVRVSAKGKRYLIIPFRHNTPGPTGGSLQGNTMPAELHAWWQDASRERSAITGHGWRDSGTGALAFRDRTSGHYRQQHGQIVQVRRRTYSWGSRVSKADLADLGITGRQASRLVGMVNFRRPGAVGGAAHSKYLTFRVMSEDSPGWKVPAREGLHPARTVAQRLQPIAEEAFRRAMAEDVRAALGG